MLRKGRLQETAGTIQGKNMYDICCIGHITLDKVTTAKTVVHMAGGTSFYFSNALGHTDLDYVLVTSLAPQEMRFVAELRARGVEVRALPSTCTVNFENIYSENQDHRSQKVRQKSDPFTVEQLLAIEASIFHLGPLLADDIPLELIRTLSERGIVSLDVQGYLREVRKGKVHAVDWAAKKEALPYVDILKANGTEMEVLTGYKDVQTGTRILSDWGVKEVVITLGSMGSVLYKDQQFFYIPAYPPASVVDATGCGDTYMAGYLYQRIKGAPLQDAGEFAAAMATLKMGSSGPFTGTPADVLQLLSDSKNL